MGVRGCVQVGLSGVRGGVRGTRGGLGAPLTFDRVRNWETERAGVPNGLKSAEGGFFNVGCCLCIAALENGKRRKNKNAAVKTFVRPSAQSEQSHTKSPLTALVVLRSLNFR